MAKLNSALVNSATVDFWKRSGPINALNLRSSFSTPSAAASLACSRTRRLALLQQTLDLGKSGHQQAGLVGEAQRLADAFDQQPLDQIRQIVGRRDLLLQAPGKYLAADRRVHRLHASR